MKKSDKVKQSALDYTKKKGLKPIDESLRTGNVDPKFAAKVAQAYQDMHHSPNDPRVKQSYNSLLQQTADQYRHLKEGGLKLSPIKRGQQNPYAAGSKALLQDLHENNHMWYYPTEQGFGSEGQESKGNPLLKPMGENIKGHNLLANDMFRIVHDYFGHGMSANTFGAKGEENAYREHKQMFTPEAHGALTSETRGQNSWVNFGPHGEQNRKNPQNTIYAPQKAGLMPSWTQKIYKNENTLKKTPQYKYELEHYSPQQGLKTISPSFKRTGFDDSKKANQLSHDISVYYPKGQDAEHVVKQPAKSKYNVKLGPEHKIFDPAEHGREHIEAVTNENQGAFNLDKFITRLKEHGFHGFKTSPQGIKMVALFHDADVHSEEPVDHMVRKKEKDMSNDIKKSKNVREQKAKVWGRTSQPSAKSPMREKHMEHIKDFAQRRYGLEMHPSGGKIDAKTGERRDVDAEVGVDKPDWRSGKLEAQSNPDAQMHELGHVQDLPPGIGLKEGQTYMDKQYADVQRDYGYMKQKQSQPEIQPMGLEQLLRRRAGLPANRSAVPVKSKDAPPRLAVDTGEVAGTRVQVGQDKGGNPKYADLIRQSRFVRPEAREKVDKVDRKELVFDKERGWVKPDISNKKQLRQNIDSLINVRARELAKDPTRKDKDTLLRSEKENKKDKLKK